MNINLLIQEHQRQIDNLVRQQLQEAAMNRVLGDEDEFEETAVIVFDHKFNQHGRHYTYAALKVRDRQSMAVNECWWVTGRNCGAAARTWESLKEFIMSGEPTMIATASEWNYLLGDGN